MVNDVSDEIRIFDDDRSVSSNDLPDNNVMGDIRVEDVLVNNVFEHLEAPRPTDVVGSPETERESSVFFLRAPFDRMLNDLRVRGSKDEAGGVLFGKRIIDKTTGKLCTIVSTYLPAENTVANSARLTYTADSWAKALREIDTKYEPGKVEMVGWVHTHPGWGLFLSQGHDQFICDTFFDQDGQVAVVFDPSRAEQGLNSSVGVFSRKGTGETYSTYSRHSGFYLFDPRRSA